jgi:hypothetical protein
MKIYRNLLILALIMLSLNLFSYQRSFFSLVSPTELGFLNGEISVQHRFRGAIDDHPADTFFGIDNGANVALCYRQAIMYGAEAKIGIIRENKEYFIDGSWHFTKQDFPVQSQVNLEYFSYKDFMNPDKRHNNILLLVAAQNKPLYDRFYLNANLGYNSEAKALGFGIGAGLKVINSLTVLGEYYPDTKNDKPADDLYNSLRKYDTFSFGVKLDTYGHQFMFMLGNNEDMNMRQIVHGSATKDLKLGFNVQRRIGN